MLFIYLQISTQFLVFWYMSAPKGNKFAEGNEGGRPTKFTEETLQNVKDYLEACKDENEQIVKQSNSEKGYEMYENRLRVSLPSVAGLARWMNVSRETIYAWKKENKEFSDSIDDIQAEQEKRLLENGLAGTYNPTIAKLLLTKHGYSDKQELLGKDGDKLELGVVILPSKNEDTLETTE